MLLTELLAQLADTGRRLPAAGHGGELRLDICLTGARALEQVPQESPLPLRAVSSGPCSLSVCSCGLRALRLEDFPS
jgi:hypothetical protein